MLEPRGVYERQENDMNEDMGAWVIYKMSFLSSWMCGRTIAWLGSDAITCAC